MAAERAKDRFKQQQRREGGQAILNVQVFTHQEIS
jgi:hypothetical protein